MDEKFLIANSLVPDNEVWVSPKTFENPFSKNVKEALPNSAQQLKVAISFLESCCAYLPDNDFAREIGGFLQATKQATV